MPTKPVKKPLPTKVTKLKILPPPHVAIKSLTDLVTDLQASLGDGGTVEQRQATIDRLNNIILELSE